MGVGFLIVNCFNRKELKELKKGEKKLQFGVSEVDEGEAEMVGIGIDGICQLLSSDMTHESPVACCCLLV
ncbi:hypothetical protein Pyn_21007 [Prunus yedoensis var. nudiflora]|uniref:Uncharacterized protein n=1 Tax=Prunus yedoensis var. nudiflora TaxID=2094558 RepID=A0A315B418_PRUYE|nr:hypothetical protein Pyn_21007 [Prunus yedoensis var. nudiflora]